jgi:hypothetical protein
VIFLQFLYSFEDVLVSAENSGDLVKFNGIMKINAAIVTIGTDNVAGEEVSPDHCHSRND